MVGTLGHSLLAERPRGARSSRALRNPPPAADARPPTPHPPQAQALLHGHSYTAYPIGCAAALASLSILESPQLNPNACCPSPPPPPTRAEPPPGAAAATAPAPATGAPATRCAAAAAGGGRRPCAAACGALVPMWGEAELTRISHHRSVEGVVAIGTVLAVELKPPREPAPPAAALEGGNCDGGIRPAAGGGGGGSGGYLSGASAAVVAALRALGVFARPLGSVVYVMVTPTTPADTRRALVGALDAALGEHPC